MLLSKQNNFQMVIILIDHLHAQAMLLHLCKDKFHTVHKNFFLLNHITYIVILYANPYIHLLITDNLY